MSVAAWVTKIWDGIAWRTTNGAGAPPAPQRAPRIRKDTTVITDDVLRRYADDHKSGIKRRMARELLAARAVVLEARALATRSERVIGRKIDELPVRAQDEMVESVRKTADALLAYDQVFVKPPAAQLPLEPST